MLTRFFQSSSGNETHCAADVVVTQVLTAHITGLENIQVLDSIETIAWDYAGNATTNGSIGLITTIRTLCSLGWARRSMKPLKGALARLKAVLTR